jgi:hypothetical protein
LERCVRCTSWNVSDVPAQKFISELGYVPTQFEQAKFRKNAALANTRWIDILNAMSEMN